MRGKFFVARNNLYFVGLSGHNDLLAGDSLTTLTLNYEWRRFVGHAIERHIEYVSYSLSETETEDLTFLLNDMLLDLYD